MDSSISPGVFTASAVARTLPGVRSKPVIVNVPVVPDTAVEEDDDDDDDDDETNDDAVTTDVDPFAWVNEEEFTSGNPFLIMNSIDCDKCKIKSNEEGCSISTEHKIFSMKICTFKEANV